MHEPCLPPTHSRWPHIPRALSESLRILGIREQVYVRADRTLKFLEPNFFEPQLGLIPQFVGHGPPSFRTRAVQ